MGQAKRRGSLEQRVAEAKARLEALRPEAIICNKCQGVLKEITDLNVRGMAGIEGAFGAHCNDCDSDTFAIKGEPNAVQAVMEAMAESTGHVPLQGFQSGKLE